MRLLLFMLLLLPLSIMHFHAEGGGFSGEETIDTHEYGGDVMKHISLKRTNSVIDYFPYVSGYVPEQDEEYIAEEEHFDPK